jgi:hypothetical protein
LSDDTIQDARIALNREFGSNARNWYNVLLAMAVVLFAAVQVRKDLACMGVWEITLAIIFSQVTYAVIRAAVSVKLAREVVTFGFRPDWPPRNILGELDDKVRKELKEKGLWKLHHWKIGLDLGDSLLYWLCWTVVVFFVTWPVLVCLLRVT